MLPYDEKLVKNARVLRKNMTPEERYLWYNLLRKLPCTVKRQHNIENYIVDFYIASRKIVIEIDGLQHESEDGKKSDKERDAVLNKWGITVVRYSNRDINFNFQRVSDDILDRLNLTPDDIRLK